MSESESLPANETVRLITGITGVMHTPRIIEGETSGSGKTISVDHDGRGTVRLDTSKILGGDSEFRKSTYFELYTPKRLQKNQKANHAPGPQAGSNGVSDAESLPEPTHTPPGEEAYPDVEDESEDDESDESDVESIDQWDLSRYNRGDTLILDSFSQEFLIVKVERDQFGNVQALDVIDEGQQVYQLKKLDLGGYCFDVRRGRMDGGQFREDGGTSVLRNVDEMDRVEDFERTGQDMDWLRQVIRSNFRDT